MDYKINESKLDESYHNMKQFESGLFTPKSGDEFTIKIQNTSVSLVYNGVDYGVIIDDRKLENERIIYPCITFGNSDGD